MKTNLTKNPVSRKSGTASVVKIGRTYIAYDHNALIISSAYTALTFYSKRIHGRFIHTASFDESDFDSFSNSLTLSGIELNVIKLY